MTFPFYRIFCFRNVQNFRQPFFLEILLKTEIERGFVLLRKLAAPANIKFAQLFDW